MEHPRKPAPVGGQPFGYVLTDEALSMLHRIDVYASGKLEMPEAIVNESTQDRYLVSSLMEEAIGSSLLEGAATTRREAKELLRSGRTPRARAGRMVVNNYRTMQHIRRDLDESLSVEMILEIHRMVTDDTVPRSGRPGSAARGEAGRRGRSGRRDRCLPLATSDR
jgi:Fic family protein